MSNSNHGKKGNRAQESSMEEILSALLTGLQGIPHTLRVFWEKLQRECKRIAPRARTVAHEARERNFPESNRILIQFVLFLWGQSAMFASLGHERLHALRMKSAHVSGQAEKLIRRLKRVKPVYFVSGAMVVAAIAIFFSVFTLGTAVTCDGTLVDTVGSLRTAKRTANKIEDITVETLGDASYSIEASSIHYAAAFVRRSELADKAQYEQDLAKQLGQVSYGYSLYVNDELIGSTQYEGALDDLLEQVKQLYVSPDTLEVGFVESIRIAEGYVPTESVMNLGEIAELLNSTKEGEITYTVVKGDTWGQIANNNGMSSSELELLNPGYDINRIHVGDVLTISNAVPYLTVSVKERQNYVDEVDYDIVYTEDASIYQGDYRVVSKGQYGTADIVADVIYVNGVESERTELSRVMLTAPVTEYRLKGTKPRPSWMPTGSLRWPVSGRISSYFGYRNTGIRGASSNHKGIDITCSYGTPICAADGGTVTYSGWWGSGGYTVIIDHGNGLKTYYEHNSSLLVSVGSHVYKGQTIAKAGRTGVASGVHCHFGVERNGSYVNPLKYLN